MAQEQNHPLYSSDRQLVDSLMSKASPEPSDLVELARLFMRYDDFPGARDLKADMDKILRIWNFSKDELNTQTRSIWSEGFRPSSRDNNSIGSGFDTSDNSNL